jgi:hypothetical protein
MPAVSSIRTALLGRCHSMADRPFSSPSLATLLLLNATSDLGDLDSPTAAAMRLCQRLGHSRALQYGRSQSPRQQTPPESLEH